MRRALVDALGRTVREVKSQTRAGGISGGEMAITPDMESVNYTIHVSSADGTSAHVFPQSRSLEIIHEETPQIAFDRNSYKPGDKVGVNFRGGGQAGNTSNSNKDLAITLEVDDQPVPKAVDQVLQRTDNAGNLNFQAQLPQQIKNGAAIIIGLNDGKKDNKLVQSIPIVSSERIIDFFPEGGGLVAGVANRVYYRVRSPQGEPAQPEGRIAVLAGGRAVSTYSSRTGRTTEICVMSVR